MHVSSHTLTRATAHPCPSHPPPHILPSHASRFPTHCTIDGARLLVADTDSHRVCLLPHGYLGLRRGTGASSGPHGLSFPLDVVGVQGSVLGG